MTLPANLLARVAMACCALATGHGPIAPHQSSRHSRRVKADFAQSARNALAIARMKTFLTPRNSGPTGADLRGTGAAAAGDSQ